jgi:putative heme-binding domain-containing protein
MFNRISRLLPTLLLGLSCTLAGGAEDPFKLAVRSTDPLTPAEQLKKFHLPKGFEIQLVAAEPDLRKPMNMAFDSSGRLWVTESREYPVAAPTNSRPRDTVRIFSDFDDSGRARSIGVFATNLNIPIGIYPFRSTSGGVRESRLGIGGDVLPATSQRLTWKCIVWSIPNIWLLEDVDGNGTADTSRILYGPFDHTRDTHGNQSSFRRGHDGWLYATHGFNNRSTVAGSDGQAIEMSSGNTYRIRLDGSRIEHWSHGQVNPFGLSFDMFGNLFSADCHSSPIYQLLRGAHYPSFGKPHDGLGFAPLTIRHSHGSTAIAGIVVVEDSAWPAAYRGNILVGNVMTSRINRDRVEWRGSTTVGHELDDFLKCDDPWFRPVDLQWGPDGALYVADFYNRIIGHYEVPLTHPGRDRERGRIWRIRYVGDRKKSEGAAPSEPKKANLMTALGSPNPTTRSLALNELCDVYGRNAVPDLRALLGAANEHHYVGALRALDRMKLLSEQNLVRAIIAKTTLPRVHAMKIAGEWPGAWPPNVESIVTKSLHAENAYLRRAAAEALGVRTNLNTVGPLLERLAMVPEEDTHTRHAVRVAIRNQLRTGGAASLSPQTNWLPEQRLDLAEVALAVKTPAAASFLLRTGPAGMRTAELRKNSWEHVARYAPAADVTRMAQMVRTNRSKDVDFQLNLFGVIQGGFAKRGEQLNDTLRAWGGELAGTTLSGKSLAGAVWGNLPPNSTRYNETPWTLQERKCEDGKKVRLLSSHPKGERLRGRLRSAVFALPEKLAFYLCGHNAKPDQPERQRNQVRLRLANGRIIREARPPRHDTAKRIEWDLAEFVGSRGYFEANDGDADRSYAWFAFGRFEPALPELVINDVAAIEARLVGGVRLARELKLADLKPKLEKLLANPNGSFRVRKEAAVTVAQFEGGGLRLAASAIVGDLNLSDRQRDQFAQLLIDGGDIGEAVRGAMKAAAAGQQQRLVQAIAGVKPAAVSLAKMVSDGIVSARALTQGGVMEKLEPSLADQTVARLRALIAALPAADETQGDLIAGRTKGYRESKGKSGAGRLLFETACAACHQVDGKGGLVGPQLDGIAARGLDRLVEDILDPNRNVDVAFRTETITMKNGDVVIGLPRREEGATLVIANATGQEAPLKLEEIRTRRPTARSLMPDNFHEAMTPAQLNDLIAYLLTGPKAE